MRSRRHRAAALALACVAAAWATAPAHALTLFAEGNYVTVGWREDPGPPGACLDFRGDSRSDPCDHHVEVAYRNDRIGREFLRAEVDLSTNATYCLRLDCGDPATFGGVGAEPSLYADPILGGPQTLP